MKKCNISLFLLIQTMIVHAHAASAVIADPCAPSALLNIVDRPTVADSACAVPAKKAVLEMGYQYQQLRHSAGHAENFPEAVFRLGLPARNEFVVVLPNQIRQSLAPRSGSTATSLGLKHEIGYNQSWLAAIESLIILPNGSAAYGSNGTGVAINGIANYNFNSVFSLSLMLGGTSSTTASAEGGKRFNSINPDLVLTYSLTPKTNLYAEIYGQSKTAPDEGSGFNADGGVLYLLFPNCTVDLEVGHRGSGNLSTFNNYVGTGVAVMIS